MTKSGWAVLSCGRETVGVRHKHSPASSMDFARTKKHRHASHVTKRSTAKQNVLSAPTVTTASTAMRGTNFRGLPRDAKQSIQRRFSGIPHFPALSAADRTHSMYKNAVGCSPMATTT